MSILYISYNGSTEPIFQSQVLPYLIELRKRGMDIVLITFEKYPKKVWWWSKRVYLHSPALNPTPPHNSFYRKGRINDLLSELDIEWIALKYHKRLRLLATTYDIIQGIIVAKWIMWRRSIGIVHARSYIPAIIAWVVTRWGSAKFLFDMRGLMAEEYADGGLIRQDGLVYKLIKRIEKVLFKSADEVVVLTNKINSELYKRVVVIPCCVDLEHFKFVDFKKESNLIYIGSIGTWYCLEEMAEFFKVWKEFIPKARWLIFSHNYNVGDVRDIIKLKDISEDDVDIQAIPHKRVSEALSLGDVGIAFIKPTFSKRASCPTKIGEYLASGLPVVINAGIGDTQELVERNRVGVVLKDFTPESYTKAIVKLGFLLKDPELGKRCRQVAEKELSLSMGVDRYQAIYSRMEAVSA